MDDIEKQKLYYSDCHTWSIVGHVFFDLNDSVESACDI